MIKTRFIVAVIFISSLFSCIAYASEAQVYVGGYRLNHSVNQNGVTYVQLRELAHYIGYEIEYDADGNIVNFYKSSSPRPVIKNENYLFPVNVQELDFDGHREVVKVYELGNGESPKDISKEPFSKNGYLYELADITKSSNEGIDTKEHSETVTLNTSSQDMNTILKELPETKEYTSEDGYTGVLKLEIGSIQSGVDGYKTSTYNVSETREYPNLSSPDTSLVPKTINVGGNTLSLQNVNWKTSNTATVDYNQLADTYTAVAVYGGTGTRSNVTGYTTTAIYSGEISKAIEGKTLYTAYFTGTKIEKEPEPVQEPTIEELEQQLRELKKNTKGNFTLNPLFIVTPVVLLSVVGGIAYLLFFRRNVKVYSMYDGEYKKIGKTKVSKKNPVIDLTPFTSTVTTPSFILVLDNFIAKRLDTKTVTINYGDSSFQHIVTLAIDEGSKKEKKKGYQIELDY